MKAIGYFFLVTPIIMTLTQVFILAYEQRKRYKATTEKLDRLEKEISKQGEMLRKIAEKK